MLISHSQKFIFFHVAKTAGISIRKSIEEYGEEPEKFKITRPPKTLADGRPNRMHEMWESILLHARTIEARKELSSEVFDNYYKFAFVRNPWDWQVSMYHFILKETTHIKHEQVKAMKDFEEYLHWVFETPRPYPKGATKFQHEVICDKDMNLMVDFVGRYERLAGDFEQICKNIGIDASLPHANKSSHRDYRQLYNNTTKEMVSDYFRKDIELFGYTFDGYRDS